MKKIKEYIKNIDFDLVDDYAVLDNVYAEIKGYEEKLILDFDVSSCLEQLISKSNISQILHLVKKINLVSVINKKSGSKTFETIFMTLNSLCSDQQIKKDLHKRIKVELTQLVHQNLDKILTNRNGTFALRKYFEFVNSNRKYIEELDHKNKLLDLLEGNLEVESIITIIVYLKKTYSKRITRKIVDKFLSVENLKTPSFSFIFEDVITFGDKKTIEIISRFVENNFNELVSEKYSNYVVNKLIKTTPEKNELYFSLLNLSSLNINSNIVLRVFENFCMKGNIERVTQLLRDFYQIKEEESVFFELLLRGTTGLNTKFIDSVVYLMDLEGDVFGLNSQLIDYFDEQWLNQKSGIKLIKGFLEGGGSIKQKKQLIGKLNITQRLIKKKDGLKIQSLVKTLKKTRG